MLSRLERLNWEDILEGGLGSKILRQCYCSALALGQTGILTEQAPRVSMDHSLDLTREDDLSFVHYAVFVVYLLTSAGWLTA